LANDNGCKYTEVSAILNHKVDDLLVGIVKQIRLSGGRQHKHRAGGGGGSGGGGTGPCNDRSTAGGCLTKARNRMLAKLLRLGGGSRQRAQASKSCENLLSL